MAKRNPCLFAAVVAPLIGLLLALAFILAAPGMAHADDATLYAAPGGLTSGPCDSWANACTLQFALSIAASGDEVWVRQGVHYPGLSRSDSFTLVGGVEVYGGFAGSETSRDQRDWAANLTILSGDIDHNDLNTDGNFIAETPADLQGENSYHVVTGSGVGNTLTLDGFTITAGQASDSGGGMVNHDAFLQLQNITFSGNTAAVYGGAISNGECAVALTDVTFSGNQAQHGGAMHNYISSPVLTEVVFSENYANQFGGGIYSEGASYVTLSQVTFTGNTAVSSGGGMLNAGSSSAALTDVTFTGNTALEGPGGGLANANQNNPTLTNVLFTGNSAYNAGGGMFNSNDSNPTLTHVDFYSNTVTFTGGGLANDHSSPILTDVSFSGNTAYRGGGMYNEASSPLLAGLTFSGNSADWGAGIVNANHSTPTLTDTLFSDNSAIIGGGMYNESSSPTLVNITFTGNSASDGGGMYNDIQSNPVLTRVTFSDNAASSNGAGLYNNSSSPTLTDVLFSASVGHAMYNINDSRPTLTDVTFSGGTAYSGAGMYNDHSSPVLTNVTFSANYSGHDHGAGMFNYYSHPALMNVVFSNNSGQYGGGMSNDHSSPTLTNVTFFGNDAQYGGGLYNRTSTPSLANVILWGNTASEGAQIYNTETSTPTIAYSDIQGSGGSGAGWDSSLGADGGGNLDSDPLFVDGAAGNLHLQLASPAIDAGDSDAVPISVTTDLDGNLRFVDIPSIPDSGQGTPPIVDMGAYETQFVDVMLTKVASPQLVAPGQAVTFTLTISNGGSIPAAQVIVTDTLPYLLQIVFTSTLTITDTGHSPPYVWAVQDLTAGQSGVITITGVMATPLAAGIYTNTATVMAASDLYGDNNTDSLNFTVPNAAPTFTSLPLTSAFVGAAYAYTITTQDINGDALTITASTLPAWLTLTDHGDGTASLSGAPSSFDGGDHAVELVVSDGDGLTDTQAFVIAVRHRIYLPLVLRNAP